MIDMKPTIIAKSDQLNADDLIGEDGKIIKITRVDVKEGAEQPCTIHYEGDGGKPYKPGKSMCRVLIFCWGDDGEKYVGRYLKLFRDSNVKWGGAEVGGIRISEMSHITENMTMPLTMSRGSKKPYTVKPLKIDEPAPQKSAPQYNGSPIADADYQGWTDRMDQALTVEEITAIGKQIGDVAPNYDQASVEKLKAYYSDRLRTIKGGA